MKTITTVNARIETVEGDLAIIVDAECEGRKIESILEWVKRDEEGQYRLEATDSHLSLVQADAIKELWGKEKYNGEAIEKMRDALNSDLANAND